MRRSITPATLCRQVAPGRVSTFHLRPSTSATGPITFVRTRRAASPVYAYASSSIRLMSANRGRIRRPDNAPTVLMQARIAPEIRDQVAEAAEASGVSFAFYLENFLKRELALYGALPILEVHPQQEELPIPAA